MAYKFPSQPLSRCRIQCSYKAIHKSRRLAGFFVCAQFTGREKERSARRMSCYSICLFALFRVFLYFIFYIHFPHFFLDSFFSPLLHSTIVIHTLEPRGREKQTLRLLTWNAWMQIALLTTHSLDNRFYDWRFKLLRARYTLQWASPSSTLCSNSFSLLCCVCIVSCLQFKNFTRLSFNNKFIPKYPEQISMSNNTFQSVEISGEREREQSSGSFEKAHVKPLERMVGNMSEQ